MLNVYEIYPAIEGETTLAGWPCVIVRLAGCNLRCTWCDTPYAQEGGEPQEVSGIVDEVRDLGIRRVVVTGGEPLIQWECLGLISALADLGFDVFVETNGSIDIGPVDDRAIVRLDLKPPSSGSSDQMLWDNIPKLKPADEVKIVIADAGDYAWAMEMIREHDLTQKCAVNLTPELETMQPHLLAEWILDDKLDVRLNLQMHKMIWGEGARGV
jgi:7-carboxy-7-deazaguanine synthase